MQATFLKPCTFLSDYIDRYLIIETNLPVDNNVLPDQSIVMALRFNGSIGIRNERRLEVLPGGMLSGIMASRREISYAGGTSNFLILFKPGKAGFFFDEPLHELYKLSIDLSFLDRFKDAVFITEQLHACRSKEEAVKLVDHYLMSKFKHQYNDVWVASAIEIIRKHKGTRMIHEVVADMPLSLDAFEKRFRKTVGASPKQFSKIIKLRNLIRDREKFSDWTELAHFYNYFDQAHFIKDFKNYSGQSPSVFFQTRFW